MARQLRLRISGCNLSCDEPRGAVGGDFLGCREDRRRFLKTLGEGDPLKMELAAELRKQTTMTMVWIAKELNAGVPNRVWNAMRRLQDRDEVGTRK